MARTGSFGRLPRSQPSLTSTLLAIAREQANQEDQNLMSAWQKGGTVDGKKVTDDMVLAHWRNRLKDISKDDPLYDTYKNVVTQYEYSIAESKMTVKYAQGKIDDRTAANFYLNWSKRIPKDSEFYRILQRDAAQYLNAAKNKAAANKGKIDEQNYQNNQKATDTKYLAAGNYLTEVFTNMARANAIVGPNQDPGNFDLSDPGVMLTLMNTINTTVNNRDNPGEFRPHTANTSVLFRDPKTGRDVTAAQVKAQLGKLDPHFAGHVDLDYYGGLLRQKQKGLDIMVDRANKTGHASDANRFINDQYATTATAAGAAAWPVEEQVERDRNTFLKVWNDPSQLPGAKAHAYDVYMSALAKPAADPKVDPALRAILKAEIDGSTNIESLATQMGKAPAGDGATTKAWADSFKEAALSVGEGKGVWTVGSYDSDGLFTPGKGNAIGVSPYENVRGLGPIPPVTVYLPQGNGLPDVPVQVPGQAVTVAVADTTGKALPTTTVNEKTVATVYNLPSGTLYGFTGQDGKMLFTRDAPWASGTQVEQAKDGSVVLHMTVQPDPSNPAFGVNSTAADGTPNYSVHPGNLVFDQTRTAAGGNPLTDFYSPTMAFRVPETEGKAGLTNLYKNDPTFKAQLDWEAHVYGAGQTPTIDPKTGGIIGWQGGSASAQDDYTRASGITGAILTPSSTGWGHSGDAAAQTMSLADRKDHDASPFGAASRPVYGPSATPDGKPLPLPSDTLRDAPHMQALSNYYVRGTINPLTPSGMATPKAIGPTISTSIPFSLPTISGPVPTPPVTPAPSSTTTYTGPSTPYGGGANSSGSPDDRDQKNSTPYNSGAR